MSKESESFINIKLSQLNPRSLVLFSFRLYFLANRASREGLSLNCTIISPCFVLCDTSILVFLISVDVIWHSFYTILVKLSFCATGIPEICSISLLPYCSSWFFLTFSVLTLHKRLFNVLFMRVFSFFRFFFSASTLAI